jgi:peptide deformylase
MAVIPIRLVPDPVLKRKALKISGVDSSVRKLIANMLDTLQDASGIGLAAPQIGASLKLVVIHIPEEEQERVLINPEVIKKTGEREIDERCLSIPGYKGLVKRACNVTVKARDENFKEIRVKAEGLLAQALEHEIDHLNGVLYIDLVDSQDKIKKVEAETSEEAVAAREVKS